MKQLFAYIRVSTTRQGDGVSLQEQRASIERFAARTNATIVEWFEERKTAAKAGRPEFMRMVRLLQARKAQGVVIHKIDRSARNFRDWADLDDVISSGIDVYFANEDLDLRSRGGRLVADMQVVVAVDYIRNLREETLKGIHGRLKQGIMPSRAPIGYLDSGAGVPKAIDPIRGPIILRLFQTYATGEINLRELATAADTLGLRNAHGKPLRLQQIHAVMRNGFYAGVIKSKRFGLFAGAHQPLVRRALFDRVQEILSGKAVRRTKSHSHIFRRMLRCTSCGRSLVASKVKRHVYYRCPTMSCPTTSFREDVITASVLGILQTIALGSDEVAQVEAELVLTATNAREANRSRQTALAEAQSIANARLQRLTTLFLDGKIDPATHEETRANLIRERQLLSDELAILTRDDGTVMRRTRRFLEFVQNPSLLWESCNIDQKRRLLQIIMLNSLATGKTLEFSMREPFGTLAKRSNQQLSTPDWDTDKTSKANPTLPASTFLELAAAIPEDVTASIDELLARDTI